MSGNDPKSLNELRTSIRNEHLEIKCVTTIQALISITHTFENEEPGYRVTLEFPPVPQKDNPFIGNPELMGGDSTLWSDLIYPSSSEWPIKFEDVVRALNIDPSARVWTAREDPSYKESQHQE